MFEGTTVASPNENYLNPLQNFRSIKCAEFAPADFNVVVGQNNHGKTNIFRAIEWFYLGKGDIDEITNVDAGEGEVELTFGGVQEGIGFISSTDNQTKLRTVLGESDTMRVMRSSKTPKDRTLYHPETGQWKKQSCGVNSAFNNCIPRFEFIEATKNLKDVSGMSTKSPIGQMLSGVLNEILEKDPTYKAFRESFEQLFQAETSGVRKTLSNLSEKVCGHLQHQFPDCSALSFNIVEPAFDDLLKNFSTRLNDGVETTAEEKVEATNRLRESPEFELYELTAKKPEMLDSVAVKRIAGLEKEIGELKSEAEQLAMEIEELTAQATPG